MHWAYLLLLLLCILLCVVRKWHIVLRLHHSVARTLVRNTAVRATKSMGNPRFGEAVAPLTLDQST